MSVYNPYLLYQFDCFYLAKVTTPNSFLNQFVFNEIYLQHISITIYHLDSLTTKV